ncbi:MAG: tetratricopeptide repeat protein [Verrucomicrobiota bacterium]
MSIGPNNDFDGMDSPFADPGESVIQMLDDILENYQNVSPEEEMKALDMLDQAYENEDPDETIELLLEALECDPANVDIHLEFLDQSFLEDQHLIPILQRLKKIARKKLGNALFKDGIGHFWLIHETRPYMRVCFALADEYFLQNHYKKAIKEWEDMLRLNPNDNQAVRHPLLMCYLTERMLQKAEALFERFDEVGGECCFSWGKVLFHFIQGDFDAAAATLKVARKQNKYMEEFINGTRKYSGAEQSHYALGSLEEAEILADTIIDTWDKYPDAIEWLKQQGRQ